MKTFSRITGASLPSIPVYLIMAGIDFKYNEQKKEICTGFLPENLKALLELYGFTDEMITIKKA